MTLRLDVPEGDAGAQAKQQQLLSALGRRTMALPLGRGALGLATLLPLPTEPLSIPLLSLSGRLSEQVHSTVNLDLSAAQLAPGAIRCLGLS